MTATTTIALPKNKTGVFAGDTLQEVKPIRNAAISVSALSSQHRQSTAVNLLLASTNQNRLARKEFQPYATEGPSGIRNGFRPSTVRRQKSRITTASIRRDNQYRDTREILSKELIPSSLASARLKSEINQLNSQLKIYGDLNRILRLQNNRDMSATPQSIQSYSTSYRVSSASTSQVDSRLRRRPSSTLTMTGITDATPSKSLGIPSSLDDEYVDQYEIDNHMTHAYQIPQRSDVGSECILPLNPPTSSAKETRSVKSARHSSGRKTISCPFYIMYFTNLAMQQRSSSTPRVPSAVSTRQNTAHSRHSSARRRAHSPVSMSTYSTVDNDNDSSVNTTSYYNNKRFSAKITAFETENSHLLKDVLRTTAWNHVQV